MRIFRRNQPKDVLFLMPIRLESEKLSKSKIRMLYCDADGKVYTSIMNRSVYEMAQEIAGNPPLAVQGAKEVMLFDEEANLDESLQYNAARSSMLFPSEDRGALSRDA